MTGLAGQILVSCEHSSNRLPPPLRLDPRLLQLHIAWDPGARQIARRLSQSFDAPLFEGEVSRLVVDLNRTLGNRVLMRKVSDGHVIPFNYGLSKEQIQRRIDRYYVPYRSRVQDAIAEMLRRRGRCVHLCVHTFTPVLAGKRRGNDIGLLHDPSRAIERALCNEVRRHLSTHADYVVWFNRPYSGTADGILPAMRQRFDAPGYVGLEIEVNQKYAGNAAALRRLTDRLGAAIASAPCLAG